MAVQVDVVEPRALLKADVIPARELYAGMLFNMSQYAEALKLYQVVMKRSPNRLNALLDAAILAKKTGKDKLAKHYNSIMIGLPRKRVHCVVNGETR
jgi:tetratricopeptide (TPR) repeat protein